MKLQKNQKFTAIFPGSPFTTQPGSTSEATRTWSSHAYSARESRGKTATSFPGLGGVPSAALSITAGSGSGTIVGAVTRETDGVPINGALIEALQEGQRGSLELPRI